MNQIKKQNKKTAIGLLGIGSIFFLSMQFVKPSRISTTPTTEDYTTKEQAYLILKNKCNVCHKTRNPFKVFNLKNMNKHASKIEKQVFVLKRMPKGNETNLTNSEKETLKAWLKSINQKI